MKRYKIFPVILIFLFSKCNAQTRPNQTQPCDFYSYLSFKNGIDTLTIKGLYMSMGKLGHSNILKQLEKEKKLKSKEFGYAVYFQPENCEDKFYVPSRDISKEAKSLFKIQTPKIIYLTCIFFEGYNYEGPINRNTPFFIVDKISFEDVTDK